MSENLRKKAIDLLLQGATLVSEPCPYCHGVRVMKDGSALCISCGKSPEKDIDIPNDSRNETPTLIILEKKLKDLSKQLENEQQPNKQQEILKSINSLIDTIEKLKNNN